MFKDVKSARNNLSKNVFFLHLDVHKIVPASCNFGGKTLTQK